jgi:hypothetical protein
MPAQYVTCMTTLQSAVSTINDLLLEFFLLFHCKISLCHSCATVVVFTVSCNFLFSFYDESTLPLCHLSVAVCDLDIAMHFLVLLLHSWYPPSSMWRLSLQYFVLWWGDFSWCFGAPYRLPEDV